MSSVATTPTQPATVQAAPREASAILAPARQRRVSLLDLISVFGVLTLALAIRIAFLNSGAPMFVTPDSESYVLPGWELAHGEGFRPELRRTPAYPVFIAAAFRIAGDDLQPLAAAQHILGVGTALLVYLAGRLTFGWAAGLLGGLAVAVSGPTLIYEHYLLSEGLFTFLLTGGLTLMLAAAKTGHLRLYIAAGLALGLGALCRPIGQIALPLALLFGLLASGRAFRRGLLQAGAVAVGIGLVLVPWMIRNYVEHGTFAAEGALGQALIGRTVRHDRGFVYDDPQHPDLDPMRAAARRIIAEEAATGEPSGGVITARTRAELGLTQAETSALLRSLALQAIWERRDHYLRSTLTAATELYNGKIERLLGHWRQRTTRNWDRKWDPRIARLVDHEEPAEGPSYDRADWLSNLAQPFRHRRWLTLALVCGAVLALFVPSWRPALLLLAVAGAIVLASAGLDGAVYRYRYPVDPALAVLIAGGLVGPFALVWRLFQGGRTRRAA